MLHKDFNLLLNQISTKLRGKYISLFKNNKIAKADLLNQLNELIITVNGRCLPKISYPDLPVAEKVSDIKELITNNQVIVVAGETGSGKSTQLPKICLDMGLGKRGLIGHTQPRRLAARSIADRVASEIGDRSAVSYKIRFSDQTSDNTLVKVMTDGVLLAEIKNDRYLSKYEVIIIDEAHERSLNIDFLLGCIKKILPFRPDLKIIITSATIDHQKFVDYFGGAGDIAIVGRTYPVDIVYQGEDGFLELSLQERILYAIDDLGRGDVLVFLPTERDIHETLAYLNKQELRLTHVLPLFSRLSIKDQNQIFNPQGSARRIILATNVAETSLTVPDIKFVIDSGLARVSRYSYRTKVQRLPIENISQASANQRAGRCGRLSAGICIRLYSEEDFNNRIEFTDPEILRTNLSSVILQMLYLKLGNIQDFPFIDPPDQRFVKDGYKLLFELQAISELSYSNPQITQDGQKMAIMPLDPKLAKMVLEGHRQNCLKEILSIVSFLSVQDPRERPLSFQQKSDAAHAVDKDQSSDFIGIINLANRLHKDTQDLSNREKKDYYRKNLISPVRFNEWNDIYRQIVASVHAFKWKLSTHSDPSYENLHKALISGLLGNIGFNNEGVEYAGARGLKFFIFPGSAQFKKKPKWMLSSEIIETTKIYARTVAKIEPEWIESLAPHLVKRSYDDPVWSKKQKSVVVNERVSLYGLEIVANRTCQYGRIDLEGAREIFIREALVNGEFESRAHFYTENLILINQVEDLENKSRRRDILVDEEIMYAHYDKIVPDNVCDGVSFERWVKLTPKEQQNGFVFDIKSIMNNEAEHVTQDKYPDMLSVGNMRLPLEYNFDPLAVDDGATLTLPISFLDDINPNILEWGVYGFLYEKIVAMLRALPKNIRKSCVPVPKYAQAILESIDFEQDRQQPFKTVLAKHITRIVGAPVDDTVWEQEDIDKHLLVNIKVVDEQAKQLSVGRNIHKLREELKQVVIKPKIKQQKIYHDWDFGDIKPQYTITQYGVEIVVYGCLECNDDGVHVSYQASKDQAELVMSAAISRLIKNRVSHSLDTKIKKNSLSSLSMAIKVNEAKDAIVNRAISLSFIEGKPIVYTKKNFEALLAQGLKSFDDNKKDLELLITDIEKQKQLLIKQLTVRKIPLNFIELYADIKKSLDTLFYDSYIADVPYKFLTRYKYYVQALDARLSKAVQNLQRDRAYAIEISELVSKLNKVVAAKNLSSLNSDVLYVKFLITELWVSWYLQSVKTIEPVSSKRISKKTSEIT